MIEKVVDFNDMSDEGKFSFTFPTGLSVPDVDAGILLKDDKGNVCHGIFTGIQSQRDYTVAVVTIDPSTWHGAYPPEKVRSLKSL